MRTGYPYRRLRSPRSVAIRKISRKTRLAALLAFSAALLAIWVRLPGILIALSAGKLASAGMAVSYAKARTGLDGTVTLTDLHVTYEAAKGSSSLVLTAPKATVALRLRALFRREIVVKLAELEKPKIEMRLAPRTGSTTERPVRAMPIRIEHLVVTGATLGQEYRTRGGTVIDLDCAEVTLLAGGGGILPLGATSPAGAGISGDFSVGAVKLGIGATRYEASTVKGHATLDASGLSVQHASVQGRRSRFVASGRLERQGNYVFSVEGDASLDEVLPVSRISNELHGEGHLDAFVAGNVHGETTLSGRASMDDGEVFGWKLRQLDANLSLDEHGLSLFATFEDPTGKPATGRVAFFRESGAFRVDVVASALAEEVNRVHGLGLPLSGELRAAGGLFGTAGAFQAEARIESPDLSVQGIEVGAAQGDLSYDGHEVRVAFDVPGAKGLIARGTVVTERGRHRTELHLARFEGSLAQLLPIASLHPGPFTSWVRGRGSMTFGEIHRSDLEVAFEDRPGRPLSGELVLKDFAPVSARVAVGKAFTVSLARGSGEEDLDASARAASAAELMSVLRGISAIFAGPNLPDLPIGTGSVELRGRLTVPPARPLGFEGHLDADAPAGYGISCDDAHATLRLHDGIVELSDLDARCGSGSLRGALRAGGKEELSLKLDAQGVSFPPSIPVPGVLDGTLSLSATTLLASGHARFEEGGDAHLALSGTPSEGSGRVVLSGALLPYGSGVLNASLPVSWTASGFGIEGGFDVCNGELGTITGEVTTQDGQVRVRGGDVSGALALEGLVEMSEKVPFDVHLRATDFKVPERLLREAVAPGAASLSGSIDARLSGELRATGTRDGATLSAQLSGGKLLYAGNEIVSRVSGRATLGGGGISDLASGLALESFSVAGPEVDLRTSRMGGVPHLTGTVGMRLLESLWPQAVAAGKIRVDYAPTLERLEARLEDVDLSHPDFPLPLRQVRGPVVIASGALSFPDLHGEIGDGPFLIEGSISQSGGALTMRVFPVTLPSRQDLVPGLQGALGGKLSLTRSLSGRIEVAGALRLTGGSYGRDVDLSALLTSRRAAEVRQGSSDRAINVEVLMEDPVVVKNDLLSGTVAGNVRLSGFLFAPTVGADLRVSEDARLTLRGQRYRLERGELTARDLLAGDWATQVRAHTTIKGYDITLDLSGGGRRPIDTSYSSDPSLPREDIQALLLFGTTADKLPPGMLQAMSGALVLAPLVKEIETRGRSLLGVDRVRIEPYVSEADGATTARVTLEKDLGKDLSMIYSGSAGPSREDLVVIEYRGLPGGRHVAATREIDGTYTVEIGHEISFGGP